MKTLHFSTLIHAPAAKVWKAMLGDTTYRLWMSEFAECSKFEVPGPKALARLKAICE